MDAGINNIIYMELHSGPKMANGTCGKTIIAGTIDRGSTVYMGALVTNICLMQAAFTRATPQRSVVSTRQPKGVDEISVEDVEEDNLIVSQPFKRRRNVKTNPYVFKDAFEDVALYSSNSVAVVSNR